MAISVIVTTHNSEMHLENTLKSCSGFREVIVCDMGSTDATLEIARNAGVKVIEFPCEGTYRTADPSRMTAMRAAKGIWVLFVRGDEIIPDDLHDYLMDFVKEAPDDISAIYIPRRNFVFNIWRRSTYPDFQLRFLRRDGTYWPEKDYSTPQIAGRAIKIPSKRTNLALVRLSDTVSGIVRQLNSDTTHLAEKDDHAGKGISLARLVLSPTWVFLRAYFLRGACRYGIGGYVSAKNQAMKHYVRLAKLYERQLTSHKPDGNILYELVHRERSSK